HAMLNGGARLGWLCDVALGLNQDRWGSDLQWKRATDQGIALPAHVAIERVQKLFGPIGVGDSYASLPTERAWRLLVGGAAKLRDPLATVDKHLSLRLIDRSTRSTTMGSLRALAESGWHDGLVPLVADPRHPWRSRGDDHGPVTSPLWESAGTTSDRRAFLADVARMP
ncbi:MAG: hypothetical protein ABI658_30980, partial [Acidimicrobiales bacterium]